MSIFSQEIVMNFLILPKKQQKRALIVVTYAPCVDICRLAYGSDLIIAFLK